MANDRKPPKGASLDVHTPDALDLLEIERRIERLEQEAAKLEASSKLIPGRSKKLADVNKKLAQLRWVRVSAREQVSANRYQSEIYEREVAAAKLRAAEQKNLDELRRRPESSQSAQGYRAALRAYVANWKAKPKVSAVAGMSHDDGHEPD
jgi:chromosome segregation ATPase